MHTASPLGVMHRQNLFLVLESPILFIQCMYIHILHLFTHKYILFDPIIWVFSYVDFLWILFSYSVIPIAKRSMYIYTDTRSRNQSSFINILNGHRIFFFNYARISIYLVMYIHVVSLIEDGCIQNNYINTYILILTWNSYIISNRLNARLMIHVLIFYLAYIAPHPFLKNLVCLVHCEHLSWEMF